MWSFPLLQQAVFNGLLRAQSGSLGAADLGVLCGAGYYVNCPLCSRFCPISGQWMLVT